MELKEFAEKNYKGKQPEWGFNGLGYVTYKRTYARPIEDRTEEWWETILRCTQWLKDSHIKMGVAMPEQYYEHLYDITFNLKASFSGRMLWQAGTQTVEDLGGASLCNCLSGDTKILTREGHKLISELVGQEVEVMDGKGHWTKSKINSYGNQELIKLELERNGSAKTVFATREHGWFRRAYRSQGERDTYDNKRVRTDELKVGDKLVSVRGSGVSSFAYMSQIGVMSGVVFGDGTVNSNLCSLRLCGDKDRELEKYFEMFPQYSLESGDTIIHHMPKYFKEKPLLDMDRGYLYSWLAGYFAADGHVAKGGEIKLASASKENLEFVEDICAIIGISTRPITVQYRKGFNEFDTPLYTLGFIGSTLDERMFLIEEHRNRFNNTKYKSLSDWTVQNVEVTDRFEEVFCAVVPTTQSFVLDNNLLTSNCWAVVADCKEAFVNTMDYLMLGGGVGYNIQKEHVHKLPSVRQKVTVTQVEGDSADFIVPDSREGWVELLDRTLSAFLHTGESFTYSTHLVRPYGTPIKGFGGVASGPEPLITMIGKIVDILQAREGQKLRPLDALDIMNCLGECVVAGNVRRSAQIALGDINDEEFLNAKRWDLGTIPNHRAMSNNTAVCSNIDDLPEHFWDGYEGKGEPYGLFNLDLIRQKGRLVDTHRSDPNAISTNPCAEISLAPSEGNGGAESCNLIEIFLNNIKDEEELENVAKAMYVVAKTVAMLPYHQEATNDIVHSNLRLGIGLTGIVMRPDLITPGVLSNVYRALEVYDHEFSAGHRVNESIKLTTVKPSGTLSLLGGATAGVHPAYSKHYIRRIRMSADDSLVQKCKDVGYHVEYVKKFDGSIDAKTVIVEFPIETPDGVLLAKDTSAIKQMELHKHMQTHWADNQVSVTVYYRPEELEGIKQWLRENYNEGVKTISFLLHSEHGFDQAPYEEIDESTYKEMSSRIGSLELSEIEENTLSEGLECSSGFCPVR